MTRSSRATAALPPPPFHIDRLALDPHEGAIRVWVGGRPVGRLHPEAVAFAAFFIGQAILSGTTPHAVLSQPGVLRSVLGSGLYLSVLGLFGLGLGLMIRHTAGAISTFVGVLLILPLIVQALPFSVADKVGKFLPASIGVAMITTHQRPQEHFLAPWPGFGLLCLYAAAALTIGVAVLVRKDA
jgi:hypothetical protein